MEGVLEWNQIPSPIGQVPKNIQCAGAHFLYAPIRTYTHLYAPLRTIRIIRTMRRAFGCFFEPRPCELFFHLKFNTSQKSRLVQCQETLAALHVEATSAFRPSQHCTWEFLNIERRRSRILSRQDHKNIEHREKVTMNPAGITSLSTRN